MGQVVCCRGHQIFMFTPSSCINTSVVLHGDSLIAYQGFRHTVAYVQISGVEDSEFSCKRKWQPSWQMSTNCSAYSREVTDCYEIWSLWSVGQIFVRPLCFFEFLLCTRDERGYDATAQEISITFLTKHWLRAHPKKSCSTPLTKSKVVV